MQNSHDAMLIASTILIAGGLHGGGALAGAVFLLGVLLFLVAGRTTWKAWVHWVAAKARGS